MALTGEVLWTPPSDVLETTEIGRYVRWLREERGLKFEGYDELWRWSVGDLEAFWRSVWDFYGVRAHTLPNGCSPRARCPAPAGSRARA